MLVFLLYSGGNFELDLTSHLFYKLITVVSSILLYHMYGRRFLLFFLPPGFNIGRRSTITEYDKLSYMLLLIQHSRMKVGYSPPQKKIYIYMYE